jgi:hypothetical protein
MMKKKFLLLIMSICILSTSLIACGKTEKDQKGDNKPKVEDKKDNSSEKDDSKDSKSDNDKAVGDSKTQDSSSNAKGNVADLEDYTVIVDVEEGINYKKGDYSEVDFAVQLLKDFFAGKNIDDRIVSDNDDYSELIPITAEDKSKLDKMLKMTRLDLDVADGKNINVEPLKIEKDMKLIENANCDLSIQLKLMPEGSEKAYSNMYGVNIFKINGEYKGRIS